MQIIVLVILILVNAFFAASEIAFISLNDAKIDIMAKEGNKKAKKIAKMLNEPSKFLSTIQIGITLAGFLSSAFASDAFAEDLAPVLYSAVPSVSLETWKGISIIIITMILSYFTLIFGELVPKRIAMKKSELIAFGSIGVIQLIAVVTSPVVKFLEFSTNIVSKLFGVTGNEEEVVTEEEIRMMVDVGQEKGTIEQNEKEMINNIFEFNDRTVSEIMVPRNEIFALNSNLAMAEAIEEIAEDYKYSRIPVYQENMDQIIGILYIKDMLLEQKNKNTKIKNIVKDAYFVPDTKNIDELFSEMRKNKKQIAIVIDEYGGTAGLVTMEDILEEIVGDIFDEFDEFENEYEKIDENTYLMDGGIPIYECKKILNIDIPEGDYETLSGYLIDALGRIPAEKEKPILEINDIVYKIEKIKNKKIMKVKLCITDAKENEENEEEE